MLNKMADTKQLPTATACISLSRLPGLSASINNNIDTTGCWMQVTSCVQANA